MFLKRPKRKIDFLIVGTQKGGIVKPEPLKHGLKGYWSRRITQEHRIVYKISGKKSDDQK